MRKCSIFFLIILLLSSFQSIPHHVFAEEISLNDQKKVEAYVTSEQAEYVELYEDEFGENVKTLIPNNSLVLLESEMIEEQFVSIIYEHIETDEIITGYVKHDEIVIKEVTTDSHDVISEQHDDEEATESEEEESVEQLAELENLEKESNQATSFVETTTLQENVKQSNVRLKGIALQSPTHVYANKSTQANVLKSYRQGNTLLFTTDDNEWYEATVYVNGVRHSGYIYHEDVDIIHGDETVKEGNALLQTVSIYERPSKEAKVLKSYQYGHKLKYRTYSSKWYIATVYVNGVRHTGYIFNQDVSPAVQGDQVGKVINGVGLKIPTNVYASKSRDANVLRSYPQGHSLKYREHTADWYIATVYLNGIRHTGYIHKDDVGSPNSTLRGISQKEPTHVYSSTSQYSHVLKSYASGRQLMYKPYNNEWFTATVYINGVRHTGYIYHEDVGNQLPALTNFALKQPTNVYASTSRFSTVLRSYRQGHLLKFQQYNDEWYRAVVIISGVRKTGYIHHDDVGGIRHGTTVVIDAGHGGHDPGASGNGIIEKSLALSLSKIAKEMLESAGVNVIMTRETDRYLTLNERSQIANNSKADLFVSIHGNSFNGSASGIETYWYDKYASAQSEQLAAAIQKELIRETGGRNRGVKKGNFHVIRETKIPSALVEVGFIDNKEEAEKLKDPNYQRNVVRGIVNGILTFLK